MFIKAIIAHVAFLLKILALQNFFQFLHLHKDYIYLLHCWLQHHYFYKTDSEKLSHLRLCNFLSYNYRRNI